VPGRARELSVRGEPEVVPGSAGARPRTSPRRRACPERLRRQADRRPQPVLGGLSPPWGVVAGPSERVVAGPGEVRASTRGCLWWSWPGLSEGHPSRGEGWLVVRGLSAALGPWVIGRFEPEAVLKY
jgi:hypothetical protein